MKRWISLLAALALLVGMLPVTVWAEEESDSAAGGTCGESLTWTLDESGVLTISGTGDMEDYASHLKTPWTSNRADITGVVVEAGVTSIGECAFSSCGNLTQVTMPETLTSIGMSAFYNCDSLTAVTIPQGVTTLGNGVFKDCASLAEVTIPGTVTEVPDDTFYECRVLTDVTLSEGITALGSSVFYHCTSLEEITLPASMTEIGEQNFVYCTALKTITVAEGSASFYSDASGVLYDAGVTTLICCPAAFTGDYVIPDTVTSPGRIFTNPSPCWWWRRALPALARMLSSI